jgi:Xaa-Pro aminopeptidase
VQSLQPTLRLGRDVWDRAAMPVSEFHDRADRLRGAMKKAGLDGLLLYGRGLNACGHPTYLANYIVKLPFAALVVLPREGEPALMFEGATRGRDAATATTWIDDVHPCWNIGEACLSVLAERGLTRGTLGLAGLPRLMPYDEWRTIAAGLQHATLADAEALVDRERAVKSTREQAQIRRAHTIADLAVGRIETVKVTGMTESSLADAILHDARLAGAEDVRLMIGRPEETDWAFRPPEGAPVSAGDSLFVHLAVSWERYWAEVTRTFRIEAGALELDWPGTLDARFRRLVAAIQPGAAVRDCARTARATMTPDEWQSLGVCGLGHGIGVTPEEPPILSEACADTFEPGMSLVVRALLQYHGRLVAHGETIFL